MPMPNVQYWCCLQTAKTYNFATNDRQRQPEWPNAEYERVWSIYKLKRNALKFKNKRRQFARSRLIWTSYRRRCSPHSCRIAEVLPISFVAFVVHVSSLSFLSTSQPNDEWKSYTYKNTFNDHFIHINTMHAMRTAQVRCSHLNLWLHVLIVRFSNEMIKRKYNQNGVYNIVGFARSTHNTPLVTFFSFFVCTNQ